MDKHEFFKLNATYHIAPDATADNLMEDATCLMGIVSESLAVLAVGLYEGDCIDMVNHKGFSQLLYGLSYLAEMGNRAAVAQALMLRAEQEVRHD